MKLLLDECVDARLASALSAEGYDVALVHELDPAADDASVLSLAIRTDRLLVTSDLDFGELLVRTRLRSHGVVLLRLEGLQPSAASARLVAALQRYGSMLPGHLLVIDDRRERLRSLAPVPGGP
jgi:predicted nuclease of predicted toxin-antitoxin system